MKIQHGKQGTMIKLDKPATEIHIYRRFAKKVNQDKLGRVHITVE